MRNIILIAALCHFAIACETIDELLSAPSPKQYVQEQYTGGDISELIDLIGPPTDTQESPSHVSYVWGSEESAEICTSELVQPTNKNIQIKAQKICKQTTFFCKLLATTSKDDDIVTHIRWQEKTNQTRDLGRCPKWLMQPIWAEIRYERQLEKQSEAALANQ